MQYVPAAIVQAEARQRHFMDHVALAAKEPATPEKVEKHKRGTSQVQLCPAKLPKGAKRQLPFNSLSGEISIHAFGTPTQKVEKFAARLRWASARSHANTAEYATVRSA